MVHEPPDAAFTRMLSHISDLVVGGLGALVPLIWRRGLMRWQGALMVLCGAVGSWALTPVLALWLDPVLPGSLYDIQDAIAFGVGIFAMRVTEELLLFVDRRAQRWLDAKTGAKVDGWAEPPEERRGLHHFDDTGDHARDDKD